MSEANHRAVAELSMMQTKQSPHQWFALRVKSRHEKAVALAVRSKGFEEFLPFYRWRQTWSDRSKWVEMPLFPGYVFCRIDPAGRLPLLTIPGVLNFVSFGKTPVPIDDEEIASVQTVVGSDLATEPCSFVNGGQRVRLERGPLAGTEGILIDAAERQQVVVNITILRRSIAVTVESQWVKPLALQMTAGDRPQ
jgi:transcription antitermination factor NusG